MSPLALLLALVGGSGSPATPVRLAGPGVAAPRYSAIVDAKYAAPDGIVFDGTPRFKTIGAALAAAAASAASPAKPYVIFILDGRYHEKVLVARPSVHLLGQSEHGTVLTYDDNADTKGPDGQPLGTRGSWTLKVTAPDFRLERMTVENGFDYLANYKKGTQDTTKVRNAQALAVALGAGSDRAVFRDCLIRGNQDTLFPDAGRSYFRGCTILGSVDFIFGAGRAVFQDCDIISLDRGAPQNNGYITAASTPTKEPYGFVFLHDRLEKATPSLAPGSVFLGRPWHPSADPNVTSSVVFIDCQMDDHIAAAGWTRMSSVDAGGTRIWYEPKDARFFEHGSSGAGAINDPGRRLLSDEQVKAYTIEKIFDGWKPED